MDLPYGEVEMASPDTFRRVSLGRENKKLFQKIWFIQGKEVCSPVSTLFLARPDSYTIYVMSEP